MFVFQQKVDRNILEDKGGQLIKSMYSIVSHIWQLDVVNLICGELGGLRRRKHGAALCHNANQDLRMVVHGDDFVSDEKGLNHIDHLLKSKIHSERHVNT